MPSRPALLAGLRRSLLGAWLACAYGLAVLAGALAPASAATHPLLRDAVLCSGLAAPGQDAPETGGEPVHCKGCPVNPQLAAPASDSGYVAIRALVSVAAADLATEDAPCRGRIGLPQSRAPPRG